LTTNLVCHASPLLPTGTAHGGIISRNVKSHTSLVQNSGGAPHHFCYSLCTLNFPEMVMKTFKFMAVAVLSMLTQATFAGAVSACPTDGYGPMQYQIYIDPPSGDAFIRTPCGWRFVRTIEPQRVAEAIRMARVRPADLEREDAAARRDVR
jgi:hypothetical protein